MKPIIQCATGSFLSHCGRLAVVFALLRSGLQGVSAGEITGTEILHNLCLSVTGAVLCHVGRVLGEYDLKGFAM